MELVEAAAAPRLAPGLSPECRGGVYCAIDGQAEAVATVQAWATAARRVGARIEEGVGADALVVEGARVVGVVRSDGERQPCDTTLVAAGAWSAPLLGMIGVKLPLRGRGLQMLLTDAAPASLTPVVGCFGRPLSLKQLADGAYLIGGGWPARVPDETMNRWEVLDDSVHGSLEIARAVYLPLAARTVARSWGASRLSRPTIYPCSVPCRASGACWSRRASPVTGSRWSRPSATSWRGSRSGSTRSSISGAGSAPRGSHDAPVIDVRDLSTHLVTRWGTINAVDGVSFAIAEGETLGLVGESGSGKSMTCLSSCACPAARRTHPGRSGAPRRRRSLDEERARDAAVRGNAVSMILQDPMSSLNPVFSIGMQVREPLASYHRLSASARERAAEPPHRRRDSLAGERLRAFPASALRRHAPARRRRHGHLRAAATPDRR